MRRRRSSHQLDPSKLSGTAKELAEVAREFARVGGSVRITGHNHLLWTDDQGGTVLTGKTMHASRVRHVVAQIESMIHEMEKRQGEQDEQIPDAGFEIEQREESEEEEMTRDSIVRRLAMLDWLEKQVLSKQSVLLTELVDAAKEAGHLPTVIRDVTSNAGRKAPRGNSRPLGGGGPWYFTFNQKQAERYRSLLTTEIEKTEGDPPEVEPKKQHINQGTIIVPVLQILAEVQDITAQDLRVKLAQRLELPGDPRIYATWSQNKDLSSKLGYVLTDLKNAQAVNHSRDGRWQITDIGRDLLQRPEPVKRSTLLHMVKQQQQESLVQVEPEPAIEPTPEPVIEPAPAPTTDCCDSQKKLNAVAAILGLVPGGDTERLKQENADLLEQLIAQESWVADLTQEVQAAKAREQEAGAALEMLRQVFK